jgi:hypothetical protein
MRRPTYRSSKALRRPRRARKRDEADVPGRERLNERCPERPAGVLCASSGLGSATPQGRVGDPAATGRLDRRRRRRALRHGPLVGPGVRRPPGPRPVPAPPDPGGRIRPVIAASAEFGVLEGRAGGASVRRLSETAISSRGRLLPQSRLIASSGQVERRRGPNIGALGSPGEVPHPPITDEILDLVIERHGDLQPAVDHHRRRRCPLDARALQCPVRRPRDPPDRSPAARRPAAAHV